MNQFDKRDWIASSLLTFAKMHPTRIVPNANLEVELFQLAEYLTRRLEECKLIISNQVSPAENDGDLRYISDSGFLHVLRELVFSDLMKGRPWRAAEIIFEMADHLCFDLELSELITPEYLATTS